MKYDKTVSVKLTEELAERLHAQAERVLVSASAVARVAIAEHLDRQEGAA